MKKYILIAIIILLLFTFGCNQPRVGGDRDEHGCIPSAGYTWCEAKQKCLRAWEEPCEGIEAKAFGFCRQENVQAVFVCGEHIRVISSLEGAGSIFYTADGEKITQCGVLAPEYLSEECRTLLFNQTCQEKEICVLE